MVRKIAKSYTNIDSTYAAKTSFAKCELGVKGVINKCLKGVIFCTKLSFVTCEFDKKVVKNDKKLSNWQSYLRLLGVKCLTKV